MDAIAEGLRHFRNENKYLSPRNHIRPAMQHLNAVGGSVILDCLPREEITDIFVNVIEGIMQGDQTALDNNDENDQDLVDDTETWKVIGIREDSPSQIPAFHGYSSY